MLWVVRLAVLVNLAGATGLAANWSGILVDSKCYESRERNTNPTDTLTNVDRDRGLDAWYCSPGRKTTTFLVVEEDGSSFKLDTAGNAKAAELVRSAGKKPSYRVVVTGTKSKGTVTVDAIQMGR